MGKKSKLTHVYGKKSWTAVSLSTSSTVSVHFLSERDKILIELYGEEKKLLEWP